MSSPFSSAWETLDDSLLAIHSQIDSLGAGLDVNDDRLIRSLRDARQHAAHLRDLVRAERPDAQWTDREALRQLVRELELELAAKAKRNQERRTKLLELATQLEIGSVKHRFEARTAALDVSRRNAIEELRTEADASGDIKDLPGPNALAWMDWALHLQETKDAGVVARLRSDFPLLEGFSAEMDERYWKPGERRRDTSAQEPASVARQSLPATPAMSLAESEFTPSAAFAERGAGAGYRWS